VLGDVGDPDLVGPLRTEVALDVVVVHRRSGTVAAGASALAHGRRPQLLLRAQPPNPPLADDVADPLELGPQEPVAEHRVVGERRSPRSSGRRRRDRAGRPERQARRSTPGASGRAPRRSAAPGALAARSDQRVVILGGCRQRSRPPHGAGSRSPSPAAASHGAAARARSARAGLAADDAVVDVGLAHPATHRLDPRCRSHQQPRPGSDHCGGQPGRGTSEADASVNRRERSSAPRNR
jgi:hypothetical protein